MVSAFEFGHDRSGRIFGRCFGPSASAGPRMSPNGSRRLSIAEFRRQSSMVHLTFPDAMGHAWSVHAATLTPEILRLASSQADAGLLGHRLLLTGAARMYPRPRRFGRKFF